MAENPVELITQATTMNSFDDPTTLAEGELALIQNFVKRNGVFEVRTGRAVVNTAEATLGACYGLATFVPKEARVKYYAAVSNSKLYTGTAPPTWTERVTNLSASTYMQLFSFDGKILVNDSNKGVAFAGYDAADDGWAGVVSPRENKLIDDFESVTGWTNDANGTPTIDDGMVLHGRHAIKFAVDSAGATYAPTKTLGTAVNLAVFPSAPEGDAAVSTDKDYIRIQITRSSKADFDSCSLILKTDATHYATIVLSSIQEWVNNDAPGVVFDFLIRKSAFTITDPAVAAFNWNNITIIGFSIDAATAKTPYIIADWLRLEKSGPIAKEYGKTIADFETDETWVDDSAGAPDTGVAAPAVTLYRTSLSQAMVLDAGAGNDIATCHRTVTLDLLHHANGADADVIDAVAIRVARSSTKVAGTLALVFTSGAATATLTITTVSDLFTPPIPATESAQKKFKDKTVHFQLLEFSKSDARFVLAGGWAAADWGTITRIDLTASAHAGVYYVDQIELIKYRNRLTIFAFDEADAINPVVTGGDGEWIDTSIDDYRSDEGSKSGYKVSINNNTLCTIEINNTDIDASIFAAGISTQDSDKVGPQIWFKNSEHVDEISFKYMTNANDYYIKKVTREAGEIPTVKEGWWEARFEKREHTQVGAGSWGTVNTLEIIVKTGKKGAKLVFDQLIMTRGAALSGRYWYAVTYRNSRGARSEFSNISDPVNVKGGTVMLSNIPTSTGLVREIWRLGGMDTNWRLAGVLGDSTSTETEDTLSETELGVVLPPLYSRPLPAKTMCIYDNVIIRANLTDYNGYQYTSLVSVGVEGSIDEVDDKLTFYLKKEDGYGVTAVVTFQDRVCCFKEKGIASFDPYNLSQKPVWHSEEIGILSPTSWAVDPIGVLYFISSERKICAFNGSAIDNKIGDPIRNYLNLIPIAYSSLCTGVFFDGYVLFAIPQTGDTKNTLVLCFDTKVKCWSVFTQWGTSVFWVVNHLDIATGKEVSLLGGTIESDGLFYTYFDGSVDAGGAVIPGILRTGDRGFDPTVTKQALRLYLTAKKLTATDVTVLVEPFNDLADSTNDLSFSVTDTTHQREECGIPSAGYFPTYVGFKLTTSLGRVAIRSLAYARVEEQRR